MKSLYGRFYLSRQVILRVFVVLLAILLAGFFLNPVRNLALQSVWPRAWRKLTSMEVIHMTRTPFIVVTDLDTCQRKVAANATNHKDVPLLTSSYSASTREVKLRHASHRSFLPIVADAEKRAMLRLYLVFAEAMRSAGVAFFFAEGSLLGVVRHAGFVPWDDDLDIAVSVRDWSRVRSVLSCIAGYRLNTAPKMHWKFHATSAPYPFVDIFFYVQDGSYLWAITPYIATTLVYRLSEVFPLKTAKFEGLQVPVPSEPEKVMMDVFDANMCQSPSSHHKTGRTFEIVTLSCSSLEYLYFTKKL